MPNIEPGLFGLHNSNRDFKNKDDWGKNSFNNCFPASLACYMGVLGLQPVYLCLDDNPRVFQNSITVETLFGMKELSPQLYFGFEVQYLPYLQFVRRLPSIDLVIQNIATQPAQALRGLEIKLTALPDNQTFNLPDDRQSCELVIRPDTIVYLGMSIARVYVEQREKLLAMLEPVCSTISDWSEPSEVFPKLPDCINVLDTVLREKLADQSPLLMQPVWKTINKSSVLSENCFDIFVWSDFALTRLFVDQARKRKMTSGDIIRPARTVFWLVKMLYDFALQGKFDQEQIFNRQAYNTKNDKAFSITGKLTHPYLTCDQLTRPRVSKEALREIILGGGHKLLSPERRLDAAIVATPGLFVDY